VKAGQKLNSIDLEGVPKLSLKVRSYLRFKAKVPSYKMPEAMDVVKRMWNRVSLDSSDGPAPIVTNLQDFQENVAYYSLRLGYLNKAMFEWVLSVLILPLVFIWIWYALHSVKSIAPLLDFTYDDAVNVFDKFRGVWNVMFIPGLVLVLISTRKFSRQESVYCVDFVTYTPPENLVVTTDKFKEIQRRHETFTEDSLSFMDKLVDRTGLGEKTYFPPGTLASPPDLTLLRARAEAELVVFGSLDQLFATTNLKPREVDILIVNCSLFCPTPSLASMIVNKYKMRQDIQSYNLGGMGCSAGVISIHLAKDLLQTYKNCRAVVVSTENITQNWYRGNDRSMLITNTLFRLGGAAILLSNKSIDRPISKYRLLHSVRTHMGAVDSSYQAVYQDVDTQGMIGVRLDKDLMRVAGEALKRNITTLGPLILPWSEQCKYFWSHFNRKFRGKKIAPYMPDFRKAIDHFCIHAGGRAVLEAIEKALSLKSPDLEASRAVLHRYGNTSSSSIWYELAYLEKKGAIRKGHKIWQIAFGSGFKCNSAVWSAL
jgi:3-ketoacyl-CoA synthase